MKFSCNLLVISKVRLAECGQAKNALNITGSNGGDRDDQFTRVRVNPLEETTCTPDSCIGNGDFDIFTEIGVQYPI
jgi:hypothetical protein